MAGLFSQEMIVVILGATPVSELRGAIPLAIGQFKFTIAKAMTLSIIGNLLPVLPLLFFLERITKYLMRYPFWSRFFIWWFERTKKHSEIIEQYEAIGLLIFVGIPLPATGAWTGCVAAYLLGMKKRYAFPAIAGGVLMAAVIVTLVTQGILGSLTLFVK